MQYTRSNLMSSKTCEILIVDDHSIVRKGLIQLISTEPNLVVSAEAKDANEAFTTIQNKHFDLLVADISMDTISGIQLTERVKRMWPDLPIIILSMHEETEYVRRAFQAGADGYVTKREASEKILDAIYEVLDGRKYLSSEMTRRICLPLRAG